jgi:isocitrate lyase
MGYTDFFAPIVADAEAGFGGVLNAFVFMVSWMLVSFDYF